LRLTVDRTPLLKSLSRVVSAAGGSDLAPILSCVALAAAVGRLTLRATDLGVEATDAVIVDAESPGSAAVDARRLLDVVRGMPDGAVVSITSDENSLTIRAGRHRTRVRALPAGDLPTFPAAESATDYSMPLADIVAMVEATSPVVPADDARTYLRGAHLRVAGDALRMEATDGRRLVRRDADIPDGAEDSPRIIVPRRALLEIPKLAWERVTISVSANLLRLSAGGSTLATRLVDGTYPDCDRVVPLGSDRRVEAGARELEAAVGRVAAVAGERGHLVRLAVGENVLKLTLIDPSTGDAEEEVDCEVDGEPLEVALSSRDLLEAARSVAGDAVVLELSDGRTPVLVSDKADPRGLHVLMPMKMEEGT
jgi:DNA polymerase-3 subunit beta